MSNCNVRQATKNMSRSKRSALSKNTKWSEAAVRGELEGCEYGRITKELGNSTFLILDSNKREHKAYKRGRMVRIGVDNVVLLNIRDYETRSKSDKAVYDIIAVLDKKQISSLIKSGEIPKWMNGVNITDEKLAEDEADLFDYDDIVIQRNEIDLGGDDSDVDVDNI